MRNLTALTLVLLAVGCASTSTQPLSSDATKNLTGKSIQVIQRESPTFVAMTSGKGMFAVAGVGAAAAAGNKLVKDKQIADPAQQIGSALAGLLASEHDMVFVDEDVPVSKSSDVDELVELGKRSDYVIDVATTGWSYIYDGFKFSDYYVGYTSKLRLIDTSSGEVISSGACAYDAKKAGKSPVTHDELMKQDAAYIKSELSDAAAHCITQFRNELLSDGSQTVAMQ